MLGEMEKEIKPNKLHVTERIAVVAAVGRKMAYQPGFPVRSSPSWAKTASISA